MLLVERGLYEFFFISRRTGTEVYPALGYLAAALVCAAQWVGLRHDGLLALATFAALVLVILAAALARSASLGGYLAGVSVTVLGVFYVAFNLSCLFPLRFSEIATGFAGGREIMFFIVAVIVTGDTFAYFTGRLFGRRFMFPTVSPKKTFEGAVGGMVGSMLAGWICMRWVWRTADWKSALLLALCVGVAGQLGDLAESAFKRCANLKDSGNILPGHGGLLDRLDSMLFGAPVMWLALVMRSMMR